MRLCVHLAFFMENWALFGSFQALQFWQHQMLLLCFFLILQSCQYWSDWKGPKRAQFYKTKTNVHQVWCYSDSTHQEWMNFAFIHIEFQTLCLVSNTWWHDFVFYKQLFSSVSRRWKSNFGNRGCNTSPKIWSEQRLSGCCGHKIEAQ